MNQTNTSIIKLKELYKKLYQYKNSKKGVLNLTGNETEIEVPIEKLSKRAIEEIKQNKNIRKVSVIGKSDIDIERFVELSTIEHLETIDFDEIKVDGIEDNSNNLLLIGRKFKKVNVKKLSVDLPLFTTTMLLDKFDSIEELGHINCLYDSMFDALPYEHKSNIINKFLSDTSSGKITIDYGDYQIKDPETLRQIYVDKKIAICTEIEGEKEFFNLEHCTVEELEKYLEKFKGHKDLYVYGNMPASINVFNIIKDVLGEVNLTALNTIDIRDSVKDNELVNFASITATDDKDSKKYYSLSYNGIHLKNIGSCKSKKSYVDINGIYDFAEFRESFNELVRYSDDITLKTANKTTHNLDELNSSKGNKKINVEYEMPYLSSDDTTLYLYNMRLGLENKKFTTICSLDDFIGMRETIDWVKEMASDNYNPDLARIVFVYDFLKTFPYKESNKPDEARNIHSVLNSEYMVCLGYASLFSQILNEMGIKTIVTLTDSHAYNVVKIDDDIMDVHGLYKFDPTADNIYSDTYDTPLKKTLKALGNETFFDDNMKYNMAFRRIGRNFTLTGCKIYESAPFEQAAMDMVEGKTSMHLNFHDDLKHLFGEDYSEHQVKNFIQAKPITQEQLSDAIVLAKDNEGYKDNEISREADIASVVWQTYTEETESSKAK